jgi:hypothetical protein
MLKAVGTCDHARQVALRQALAAGLDVVRCATSTFSRDIADPASPAASRVSRRAEMVLSTTSPAQNHRRQ